MTDVNLQWISCARKRQYQSRKAAIGTATQLKKHHANKTPEKLRPYKCPHCGGWHLSSR